MAVSGTGLLGGLSADADGAGGGVWFDGAGAGEGRPRGIGFSPDGTKVVYTPIDREFRTWKRYRGGRAQDVWIYDLERKVATRLTFYDGYDGDQVWSPDGEYITFSSDREGHENPYRKRADGSGEAERLAEIGLSAEVIDPRSGSAKSATIAFSLAFENESPQKAQQVANELVSLFLDENLRKRQEARWAEFLEDNNLVELKSFSSNSRRKGRVAVVAVSGEG